MEADAGEDSEMVPLLSNHRGAFRYTHTSVRVCVSVCVRVDGLREGEIEANERG